MTIIYVETNFLLELAFAQEQSNSCEKILELSENNQAKLILPAFCIAESFETIVRRGNTRKKLANDLSGELRQLSRTIPYKDEVEASRIITGLLVRSLEEDETRLDNTLRRVLSVAEIISLEATIILAAENHRKKYKFKHQDSIVYASVLHHLLTANNPTTYFFNRNSRDFDDPDIVQDLAMQGCKMFFNFEHGLSFILHDL